MLFAVEMFSGLVGYGYAGIIVYMILTGCGLPMPEEVAIIAGGALAANGKLHWGLTLGSLLIGALLGDCVMYYIGYHFGRRLLEQNRFWNRLITPEREKKVEAMLSQHGAKVLLGARFLVGLRGPMYITAGILKVPFRRFVLADLFCATLVVTLFFGLSYFYGAQIIKAIDKGEGWLTIAVVTAGIIVGGIALWMYLRRRKKMPSMPNDSAPAADSPATMTPVQDSSRGASTAG
ncbi:MAG TPA: DedA family protein [Pirellulales bacterium]|nr:DedA family protein [Pirellulales bacterium]